MFKRNGVYYLTYSSGGCHTDTYCVQYATSTDGPMGPFTYRGEILTTNENEMVHGPGHHSVLNIDDNYYIVYHRHNNPTSVHGFNRQVCIDRLKFDADGNILPIIPTHNGIGVDFLKPSKHKIWLLELRLRHHLFMTSGLSLNMPFATTAFRLGTDPAAGLVNHNGSFESCGAPKAIREGVGKWQFWTVTFD